MPLSDPSGKLAELIVMQEEKAVVSGEWLVASSQWSAMGDAGTESSTANWSLTTKH